jgi:hypothetical protein
MTNFKKVIIAEGIIAFVFYALTGIGGYWNFGHATVGIPTFISVTLSQPLTC